MSVIWFYIINVLTEILLVDWMSASLTTPLPKGQPSLSRLASRWRVGRRDGWHFELVLLVATYYYLPSVISYAVYNTSKRKGLLTSLLTSIWAVSLPSCGTDGVGVDYGLHTQLQEGRCGLIGVQSFQAVLYVRYQQKMLFIMTIL